MYYSWGWNVSHCEGFVLSLCGTATSGELWKLCSHNIFISWRFTGRICWSIMWATVERVYQKRAFCVHVWACYVLTDRWTGACVYMPAPACHLPVMSVCTQVCVYIFFGCLCLFPRTVTVFWSWFYILSLKLSLFGREKNQISCFALGPLNLAWLFTKTIQYKPVRFETFWNWG